MIADIQELFEGATLSTALEKFASDITNKFKYTFEKYSREREPKLYMSNLGKPLRQLWYDLRGFKGEPLSPETKLKFIFGDITEELILFLAAEAGHSVTRLQERIEVDGVSGKIDCFIDGVLVDIKSASTRSYEKFASGKLKEDDPFGYIAQLTGYAKATEADRAGFLVIGKELGKICFYEIGIEDYDVSTRIKTVREAVAKDVEPERCHPDKIPNKKDKSGNRILGTGCSYCPHKFHCWRDSNNGKGLQVRQYSVGPRFFTKLLKEPRLKYEDEYIEFPVKETE